MAFSLLVTLLARAEDKIVPSDGTAGALFGTSAYAAGDLDGDGFDDIIASAPGDVATSLGAVYLYAGSPGGWDPASEQKIVASDAVIGDGYSISSATAGDIDDDGYDDLLVASPLRGGGAVYVYYGSSAGIDAGTEQLVTASDGLPGDQFGYGVSRTGDLNGDDFGDIVVGAYDSDAAGDGSGSAYVYYGSAVGIDTSTETKLVPADLSGGYTDPYGELFPGDWFGYSVAVAGDTNRDGYGDLIVGAQYDGDNGTRSGSIYVYYGGSSGVTPGLEQKILASDGEIYDHFGISTSSAGDPNGDGYSDLIIGSSGDDDRGHNAGSAYIYYGTDAGIDAGSEQKILASTGAERDYFGISVSAAGDFDGDGIKDVVVGAREDDDYGVGPGSIYIYKGSALGADLSTEQRVVASDGAGDDDFGLFVSSGIDINGDGYDDIVVGAPGDDDLGESSGSVYIVYGDCPDTDGDGTCRLDCDNNEPLSYPGAAEVCDGLDNDCDGSIDGPGSDGATAWQADLDGDGATDPTDEIVDCAPPEGYSAPSMLPDCDDGDPGAYPGATEVPGDGIDQDCDTIDPPAGDPEGDDPDEEEPDPKDPEGGCGCDQGAPAGILALPVVLFAVRRRLL